MPASIPLPPRLYFSYGQFMVFDAAVSAPGCLWTDIHNAQGFARRESTVSFATLVEFGYADVFYHEGHFQSEKTYERAIAVPFAVVSGKVVVAGPEEIKIARALELPPGNYRIVAAQRLRGDEEELIDRMALELS